MMFLFGIAFFCQTILMAQRPNVLVIVADDLGYRDVGFQGSKEIETPFLDQLARDGVQCTSGYVSHPFCSPTRAGLLTGRYQHRFGHENNPVWDPDDKKQGMPIDQLTLPQMLKASGYITGAVGKWHLGAHEQFHPRKRGFDQYFGVLGGGHQYFPQAKGNIEYTIPLDRNGKSEPHTKYLTDHFGEEAALFVSRHSRSNQPWMLYLAFNAPHTPLQAPDSWLDKTGHIEDKNRRTYAAMVRSMDDAIGRVFRALDEVRQRENTLVFFMSDNGGPNLAQRNMGNFTDNGPLRGAKGMLYEGGIRVPFVVSWPSQLKPTKYEHPVISLDVLPTALAAAGVQVPLDRRFDGVNLIPHLKGENAAPAHKTLFWRASGRQGIHAVRQGSWKMVLLSNEQPQLYDLSKDQGEAKDLAMQNPEVVNRLKKELDDWENGMIDPVFEGPRARTAASVRDN